MYEMEKSVTASQKELAENLELASKVLSEAGFMIIGSGAAGSFAFEIKCAFVPKGAENA